MQTKVARRETELEFNRRAVFLGVCLGGLLLVLLALWIGSLATSVDIDKLQSSGVETRIEDLIGREIDDGSVRFGEVVTEYRVSHRRQVFFAIGGSLGIAECNTKDCILIQLPSR